MKQTIFCSLVLVAVCCLIVFPQGCGSGHNHDHGTTSTMTSGHDAHAALQQSKHGGVIAEFPGHKYALEIIEDEATGLVTAFVTDAHFNPTEVDAQEVQLNFTVAGTPKTYTLTQTEQESGKPATFALTDAELAELICEGWQGDATASVTIGGVPHNAKLHPSGEHSHAH